MASILNLEGKFVQQISVGTCDHASLGPERHLPLPTRLSGSTKPSSPEKAEAETATDTEAETGMHQRHSSRRKENSLAGCAKRNRRWVIPFHPSMAHASPSQVASGLCQEPTRLLSPPHLLLLLSNTRPPKPLRPMRLGTFG